MPEVIGIRFKTCGKIYDFEANGLAVRKGDRVIVESEFGLSIGTVVQEPHSENAGKELKQVIRLATDGDLAQREENEKFQRDARTFCFERIMARGLPMKLVCTEVTLDRKRIIFYFTADGRIDFRELVKDLAAKFKTRIEMRQIGVRDKAKLVGGLGLCGKELCCRLFLTSFEPISIKMAKQQDLTLNTGKLSGICGRLMCCLGYEYNDGAPEQSRAGEPAASPEVTQGTADTGEQIQNAVETCCSPEEIKAAPTEQAGEPGKQPVQKQEGFKKRKKRKRYRRKPRKDE